VSTDPHPAETPRALVLAIILAGYAMAVLDVSIVMAALPTIHHVLGFSATGLSWVVNAYALTFGGLLLVGARAGDLLGRRRMFVFGIGLFTLASLATGLAQSPAWMIGARALQGVGAAILAPATLALLSTNFPEGSERTTAMAAYGAVAGVATAAGLVLGGLFTDVLSWRVGFLLNVPIGIAAIAVTYWKVAESRDPNATRIDWGGLVTFSSALFLLVLALVRGNEEGWGSPVIVSLFAAAAVLLAAFFAIERRVAEPMLPLGFFRRRAFTGVQLAAFAVSGSMAWRVSTLRLTGSPPGAG